MDYLAVFKELENVRFQADQRARGGDEEAEGIARGAQAEQDSLRKNRKREIVTEAAAALQNRHAYSNRLGQVLHQWYSDDGTDPQVSEARLQENQAAECHAEIIRDLLPECPITRTMTSLYYLLAALLADPHPPIRRIIQVTLEKELEFRPHKDRIAVWLHGPGPRGASETPETIWLRETLARIDETR
jgi:hypothetical protein